jgi:hypothetical protein
MRVAPQPAQIRRFRAPSCACSSRLWQRIGTAGSNARSSGPSSGGDAASACDAIRSRGCICLVETSFSSRLASRYSPFAIAFLPSSNDKVEVISFRTDSRSSREDCATSGRERCLSKTRVSRLSRSTVGSLQAVGGRRRY